MFWIILLLNCIGRIEFIFPFFSGSMFGLANAVAASGVTGSTEAYHPDRQQLSEVFGSMLSATAGEPEPPANDERLPTPQIDFNGSLDTDDIITLEKLTSTPQDEGLNPHQLQQHVNNADTAELVAATESTVEV